MSLLDGPNLLLSSCLVWWVTGRSQVSGSSSGDETGEAFARSVTRTCCHVRTAADHTPALTSSSSSSSSVFPNNHGHHLPVTSLGTWCRNLERTPMSWHRASACLSFDFSICVKFNVYFMGLEQGWAKGGWAKGFPFIHKLELWLNWVGLNPINLNEGLLFFFFFGLCGETKILENPHRHGENVQRYTHT